MNAGSDNGGYRRLIVWQKAMDLVVAVYGATEAFPRAEQFGLVSQMRRCAVSIPSNIAEGSKRKSAADFRHFLNMSLGSAAELETQIEIAYRLKMIQDTSYEELRGMTSEVLRILTALLQKTTRGFAPSTDY